MGSSPGSKCFQFAGGFSGSSWWSGGKIDSSEAVGFSAGFFRVIAFVFVTSSGAGLLFAGIGGGGVLLTGTVVLSFTGSEGGTGDDASFFTGGMVMGVLGPVRRGNGPVFTPFLASVLIASGGGVPPGAEGPMGARLIRCRCGPDGRGGGLLEIGVGSSFAEPSGFFSGLTDGTGGGTEPGPPEEGMGGGVAPSGAGLLSAIILGAEIDA